MESEIAYFSADFSEKFTITIHHFNGRRNCPEKLSPSVDVCTEKKKKGNLFMLFH